VATLPARPRCPKPRCHQAYLPAAYCGARCGLLDQHGVRIHVTLGRGTILGVIEQLPGRRLDRRDLLAGLRPESFVARGEPGAIDGVDQT
jgi:hypothetical protein